MKVVHITDGLTADGAEIAVDRLHSGLRKAGIDSEILCLLRSTNSDHVYKFNPKNSRIENRLDSVFKRFSRTVGLNEFFNVSSFKIKETPVYLDSDVLVVHGYYSFSPLAIPKLSQSKTALLVLHDMWSFTGHCSHSLDCERWKIGCGKCPHPELPPAIGRDFTSLGWKLKDWAYRRSNLAVVAPSRWMTNLAKQSMLQRFSVHHIAHGIETEVYRPLEPKLCRRLLGVPLDKKILMFAAPQLTNYIKGGDLLLKALQQLPKSLKAEAVVLLLGNNGQAIAHSAGMESVDLGYVSNHHLKAICYSSADLLIHSSRAESLSYVTLESMACGTPIVAFEVGGIPDLVRPNVTGYLAEPGNAKDLCDGIVELLEDNALRHDMGRRGREIAVKEFSIDLQVQRYIDLINNGPAQESRLEDTDATVLSRPNGIAGCSNVFMSSHD